MVGSVTLKKGKWYRQPTNNPVKIVKKFTCHGTTIFLGSNHLFYAEDGVVIKFGKASIIRPGLTDFWASNNALTEQIPLIEVGVSRKPRKKSPST